MRCMNRNQVKFHYALYEGRDAVVDEYGNVTGEYVLKYGKPTAAYANVSAAKGETQTRQFGESEVYDKVIVMASDAPAIDEYSVLWIDTEPDVKTDGSTDTPYDYLVKKVARSLNSVSIAVSKVNVSA